MLVVTHIFALSLRCSRKKDAVKPSEIYYGQDTDPIPVIPVSSLSPEVISALTGPNSGLTKLDLDSNSLPGQTLDAVAGSTDWNNPSEFAYGFATSLYEEDRRQLSSAIQRQKIKGQDTEEAASARRSPVLVGEPVADVFGIQVRENSAILAVADGVSWGRKARLSARCAVHAVMDHISSNLTRIERKPNSHTVTQLLLESVTTKAQELILKHNATLTTLSAVVVCEMDSCPGEWGLFAVAVGDSPVYVYCPHTKSLTEVTVGCHAHNGERDLRMAGGTLGPSHGSKPDLANLTVAYMPVYPGDIVFCTSDGVSDNFSSKSVKSLHKKTSSTATINPRLRVCDCPRQQLKPCCENIIYMNEILRKHQEDLGQYMSAQTVASRLINYVFEATEEKREFRSDCLLNNIDIRRKSREDPEFSRQVNTMTGKLDHATVAVYQVGHHV